MAPFDFIQIAALLGALTIFGVPLGHFMARVYEKENNSFLRPLTWLEDGIYRIAGVNSAHQMNWRQYAEALLIFNLLGFAVVMALQLFQNILPLNGANLPAVPTWLALNTAVSFVTNTNWQAYAGEATLSPLVQMVGLGVQNFLSAATGMTVAVALARGLRQRQSQGIGNFWVDCTRSVVYILLPLSVVLAVVLVSQGVVQTLSSGIDATSVEGIRHVIPTGPVASQVAIKQLGTNGGGYFGVNSAHPFENPTPLANWWEMLAILLIPFATPIAFGRLVRNTRHGYAVLAAMLLLLGAGLVVAFVSEGHLAPTLVLEGKEVRFGAVTSVFWAIITAATSNGSVNAMMSSLSPLAGATALLNILLGEVILGGVGSGLYGMAMFAVLTVFVAGLMVGRTPEYLGKKIEAQDIKLAVIAVILPSILILMFSALASASDMGLASLSTRGPHGLSEILYAFASASGNNGSAFAGLNANTPFYNGALAFCMVVGRYGVILPVLALAGNLAAKKISPPSVGTFPLEGGLFVTLLMAVILIVGALTFFPALCLGPIVEHLSMRGGQLF